MMNESKFRLRLIKDNKNFVNFVFYFFLYYFKWAFKK